MPLFRWFILRRIGRERLRSGVTVAGLALGIAVIVAIQLTNASSIAGFETALNTVAGRTSLELVGHGLGIDERLLADLGWLRQYGDVSPVIEGDVLARLPGRPTETLRLLGVDILRDRPFREYRLLRWTGGTREPTSEEFLTLLVDPRSAILTAKFASGHDLDIGSTLKVDAGDRSIPLTIRGVLADEGPARVLDGNFVLMDIAAAQQALDRFGQVDRVDVRLSEPAAVDSAERAIADRLPPGITVQRPAARGRQVENMLAAFHLNLTALSYVALLVGLFLVYNTVSVAVVARRDEIGMLRALGVSRARVRALFLAEAAGLAVLGTAIGLLLARVLADAAVGLTSATVSALYIADAAAPPHLTWTHVWLAVGVGIPLSLLAALVPANEAARVPPVAAIRGADRLDTRITRQQRRTWSGFALLGLGAWLATLGPVGGRPLFGYAAALAIIFGASSMIPAVLTLATRAMTPPIRRWLGVEHWLAVTNLAAAVPRLSVSVAALTVSLSMMVALAVMIGSFRETVVYWVGQTLQADLFVGPGTGRAAGRQETLSSEVVATVESSAEVAAFNALRSTEMPYRDSRIRVGAGDFAVLLSHGSLLFKAPGDPGLAREAIRAAIGQDVLVASESFAMRYGLGVGDQVRLQASDGPVQFRIAAVYYDYSSDRGVLLMDRQTFARHYGPFSPTNLSVYLKPGLDADAARQRLLGAIGDRYHVLVTTNQSLRREVLRVFDSTFTITYALELIAILVAILGVSGTLVTLMLERERALTILRLVGADRHQMRHIIVGEAALIGAISQGVGIVVGVALSLILIYVVNVQSFGWTIQFHMPWAFFAQSTILIIGSSAIAGLYPARRAVGLAMVREE